MDTERDTTFSGPTEGEPVITTIVRGEDVLAEARAVAQKISGRVARAVTRRPPPDVRPSGRQEPAPARADPGL